MKNQSKDVNSVEVKSCQLRRRGMPADITLQAEAHKRATAQVDKQHAISGENSILAGVSGLSPETSLVVMSHTAELEAATMKGHHSTEPRTVHNPSGNSKRSLSESDGCGTREMWCNELRVNPASSAAQPVNGKVSSRRGRYWLISDAVDVALRMGMVVFFVYLERRPAFRRKIALEELWLYKYPRMPDIVTAQVLLISVILGPFFVTLLLYLCTRNRRDFRAANWVWTLALCLNGITTSLIKVTVGRPRPDFFARCFPDERTLWQVGQNVSLLGVPSVGVYSFNCTGNGRLVNEGLKSFPSGHASFAFTAYGFISFYLGAKLHAFNARGRGQTWRLLISLTPLALATLVAISRTCDYHHHYEDVFVGSLIGLAVSYATYRQYYPSIFASDAAVPLRRDGSGGGESVAVAADTNGGYRLLSGSTDEEEDCASEAAYNSTAANVAGDSNPLLLCDTEKSGRNKWI